MIWVGFSKEINHLNGICVGSISGIYMTLLSLHLNIVLLVISSKDFEFTNQLFYHFEINLLLEILAVSKKIR